MCSILLSDLDHCGHGRTVQEKLHFCVIGEKGATNDVKDDGIFHADFSEEVEELLSGVIKGWTKK